MKPASLNKKNVEPISKLWSSSSTIRDDAGPRSLFAVVLNFCDMGTYFSILQFKTQVSNHEYTTKVVEYVRFNPSQGNPFRWTFSLPTSSTEDMYMVPGWADGECCYKFNFRTGRFQPISPPLSFNLNGYALNLGRHIYYLGNEWIYPSKLESFFQCYDPDKKSWKALEPLPNLDYYSNGPISATAVWGDIILFIVASNSIWAYDVSGNKWYPVDFVNMMCCSIVGEAVVLENTIYALTEDSLNLVLALCIEIEEKDGNRVFKCSLLSEFLLPCLEPILIPGKDVYGRTMHLAHLGKDNFCIVQSCNICDFSEYQPMKLTYIKLKRGENSMIVIGQCAHEVKIQDNDQFRVLVCLSMPKCKTIVLKEVKSFNLRPKEFASNPVKGHSIYVRSLPPNASVGQLEKGLKKFGPIMRGGIQVGKNQKGKCFAFVEFENATSKQRAIETSTIRIGGCTAEILEKR